MFIAFKISYKTKKMLLLLKIPSGAHKLSWKIVLGVFAILASQSGQLMSLQIDFLA